MTDGPGAVLHTRAMLVDTHCHLDAKYFPEGPGAVLARARAAGVVGFVCIGVGDDLAPARAAIAIAETEPDVFATVGVHPHDAEQMDDAMLAELASLARHPKIVAIGEIGLDHHYDHAPRATQAEVFRKLVAVARDVKKPIVVHTREAPTDTLAILEEERAADVGGIIHCFSEDRAFAARALDSASTCRSPASSRSRPPRACTTSPRGRRSTGSSWRRTARTSRRSRCAESRASRRTSSTRRSGWRTCAA